MNPASRPDRKREIWDRVVLICWGLFITVVAVRAFLQPGRHTVFGVYRRAGLRWLEGQDLYARVGEFLYSPFAAALFAPFAMIPERLSGVIWHLLCGLGFFLVSRAAARSVFGEADQKANLALLALLPLTLGNLNNGQAGLVVITLLLIAILATGRGQWHLAAACIALSTFLKIYPLALGLLLLLFYPRQLSWRLAVWLVGFLLLSFILQRPAYALSQYQSWLAFLGADERQIAGPDRKWRDALLLLNLMRIPISLPVYAVIQLTSASGAALVCWWGRYRGWIPPRALSAAFCLSTAWMVLFGPSTESATYMILAPAVVYGCIAAITPARPWWLRIGMWASFALLILGSAKNSLLATQDFTAYARGLQPFGALVFVITALVWLGKDSLWPRPAPGQ